MYSRKIDKSTYVTCDQIGRLSGFYVTKQYPEKIRRVKFYDAEFNRTFVFLTNNMDLTAEQIALLYKNRWQVELFFNGKLSISSSNGSKSIFDSKISTAPTVMQYSVKSGLPSAPTCWSQLLRKS